jgi:hypothetical protein
VWRAPQAKLPGHPQPAATPVEPGDALVPRTQPLRPHQPAHYVPAHERRQVSTDPANPRAAPQPVKPTPTDEPARAQPVASQDSEPPQNTQNDAGRDTERKPRSNRRPQIPQLQFPPEFRQIATNRYERRGAVLTKEGVFYRSGNSNDWQRAGGVTLGRNVTLVQLLRAGFLPTWTWNEWQKGIGVNALHVFLGAPTRQGRRVEALTGPPEKLDSMFLHGAASVAFSDPSLLTLPANIPPQDLLLVVTDWRGQSHALTPHRRIQLSDTNNVLSQLQALYLAPVLNSAKSLTSASYAPQLFAVISPPHRPVSAIGPIKPNAFSLHAAKRIFDNHPLFNSNGQLYMEIRRGPNQRLIAQIAIDHHLEAAQTYFFSEYSDTSYNANNVMPVPLAATKRGKFDKLRDLILSGEQPVTLVFSAYGYPSDIAQNDISQAERAQATRQRAEGGARQRLSGQAAQTMENSFWEPVTTRRALRVRQEQIQQLPIANLNALYRAYDEILTAANLSTPQERTYLFFLTHLSVYAGTFNTLQQVQPEMRVDRATLERTAQRLRDAGYDPYPGRGIRSQLHIRYRERVEQLIRESQNP